MRVLDEAKQPHPGCPVDIRRNNCGARVRQPSLPGGHRTPYRCVVMYNSDTDMRNVLKCENVVILRLSYGFFWVIITF